MEVSKFPRKTWGAAHAQTVLTRCSLRIFECLEMRLEESVLKLQATCISVGLLIQEDAIVTFTQPSKCICDQTASFYSINNNWCHDRVPMGIQQNNVS